jgi:quercetin dioxygenase-like cupin family protein
MSDASAVLKQIGKLTVTVVDFATAGDLLPMHEHAPGQAHLTFVNRGSILARGPGWARKLVAGDMVMFEPRQQHELEAAEPASRVVNITY